MKKILLFLAVILILAGGVEVVSAQDGPRSVTDDEVNAVARQMYCPVCENTPLDVCPTQACAEWRELIRLKLSEGWNAEQIKAYFVDQYGDRVLAEPPVRGLNWLVYLLPPLAFLVGIFILYRAFRSWKQPTAERITAEAVEHAPDASQTVRDDDYIARIEEELKKR